MIPPCFRPGYERNQHPFHSGPSGFAMLGGWMAPFREGECAEWLDKTLLLLTLEGQPNLEVWETGKGLEVFARVT